MTAYVETFAEALPTKERIAEVRAELEAAGVEHVLSSWIDLFGIPKTKPVAGYVGYAGIEPEFIAMRFDENGKPVKAIDDETDTNTTSRRQAFGYDVEHSRLY